MCCNYRVRPSEQPQKNTSNTELIQCLVVRFVDDHRSRSNLHGFELILCVLGLTVGSALISQRILLEGSGSCVDVRTPYLDGLRVTREKGSDRSSRQNVSGQMVLNTRCHIPRYDLLLQGPLSSYPLSCNSLPGIAWMGSATLESGFFSIDLSVRRNSRPTACSSRPVSIHYNYMSIGES